MKTLLTAKEVAEITGLAYTTVREDWRLPQERISRLQSKSEDQADGIRSNCMYNLHTPSLGV